MDANRPQPSAQETLFELGESLRAYLEALRESGVDGLPRGPLPARVASEAQPSTPADNSADDAASAPASELAAASAAGASAAPAEPPAAPAEVGDASDLDDLRAKIGDCRRCKLASSRTQIVFGVGNPNAKLMFIGEGPGRDEDLQGEPFVGRAGQLLTEIITKGMKLQRSDVYIANVVKCRPPENRNPEPDEIRACQPFLLQQIALIQPKVIVALGKFAAQTLLGVTTPISRLRGQWHEFQGIRFMPTLHPAYLLRNPADKRLVWEDIKQVMRELEQYP